jgi:hypothetical protein
MRQAMIGLLVSGSHAFAEGTVPERPRPRFWHRVMEWLLGR